MKKILVFGTFDTLHLGHKYFLRQAKKHSDFLVVVIARDQTVKKLKGKTPYHNENQRLKNLKKLKIAAQVIKGDLKNPYQVIKKIKPDIIALGYDQKYFTQQLPEKIKEFGLKTKILRLPAYQAEKYKSSLVKIKNKR